MSRLLPALFGSDRAQADASPRMPKALFLALTLTLLIFYASNAFSSGVTNVLLIAKWGALGILLLVSLTLLTGVRRAPAPPIVAIFPVTLLMILALISAALSVDMPFSMLAFVSVLATVSCAYILSAVIIATDSRRAFFELLANLGRLMIAISAVFFVLRVDLGRGGGFSGWSANPNTLAMMLVPSVVIFFAGCIERRPGWQWRHAAFLLVGVYLIWATTSRAGIVWLALSLPAFWIYRRGLAVSSIPAMVALIVVIGWWEPVSGLVIDYLGLDLIPSRYVTTPLSGREEVWRIGWNLFLQRPYAGYGIGMSTELLTAESWRFIRHQGLHFHSSYIAAAVETGLPGLLALVATLITALLRGLGDAERTRMLPKEGWLLSALPWAMLVGSMGHALFETWLLAAGNVNTLMFWVCFWVIHHQTQIQVRPAAPPARPPLAHPAAALPAQ